MARRRNRRLKRSRPNPGGRRDSGRYFNNLAGARGSSAVSSQGKSVRDEFKLSLPIFPVVRPQNSQLMYDYGHEFTATAGAIQRYRYRANDLFDPDQTGTGHQPIGFDQLMLVYEQATVIRSRISVTFVSELAVPIRVGISLDPDTTNSSITDTMENGQVVTAMLGGVASGGGKNIVTLQLDCDVAKYFGRRGDIVNDVTLSCTAAASPTEQAYFTVFAFSAVNSTTSMCGFDAMLSYDSVYWEPRKLAAS